MQENQEKDDNSIDKATADATGAMENPAQTGQRDWTKGSILRNLIVLSWPMIVNEILWSIGPTIDMIWLGRLGATSIAGVGISAIIVMVLMAAWWGIGAGTRALVARFVGAGNIPNANHVLQQAFVIGGVCAAVIATLGVFLAESLLSIFGLEAEVVAQGAAYLRVQFVGSAAMALWVILEMGMYASGDAIRPMRITMVARAVHLILDPFLIFGWWIFPRMGVSGAATANLISYALGMSIAMWYISSGRTRLRLTLRNFRFNPVILWRIIRIGIPASISSIQRSLSGLVFMWILAPFGTIAVAAHTLVQRIEMFVFMPGMALGMAAGVLVGQNLGANLSQRAEKSGWLAVGLVEGFMIICSLVILLWTEQIIRIFTPDPELVTLSSTFLRIAVSGYLMLGLIAVLMNYISGAGDTMTTMVVSLVSIWAIQLPLAYFLPRITSLDVYGVRWAIVAGMATRAIAFAVYFRLGRWKRKKI